MTDDYYEILGVSKNSSKEDIKKSYKTLAKKYHPDLNKEKDAEEKFKKISEAYAVLSDDNKRSQYDQFGPEGFHQKYSSEDIFKNFNFNDIFGDIFGDSDLFGDLFGMSSKRRSNYGRDLVYELTIEFNEAVFGAEKEIEIDKLTKCEDCNGSGAEKAEFESCNECNGHGQVRVSRRTPFGVFTQVSTCPKCHGQGKASIKDCKKCKGTGRVEKSKKIKIKIPAGINEGNQLRIGGQGEQGLRGSHSGDLFVVVHIQPSDIFERKENDLYLELPISFSQAALGENMDIPTLEGDVKIKIPSGTQTGTKFRLKGKGVPYLDGYGKGDLYIVSQIVTPTKLSKEQKKLLEQFKKTESKKSVLDKIKEFTKIK